MSWLCAAPAVVLAAIWLVVPGLVVAYLCRLRGVVAWGVAPLLSVAVVAISAVAATAVGVGWGVWAPPVAVLLVALARLGARLLVEAVLPKHRTQPETTLTHLRRRVRAFHVRVRTPWGVFARAPDYVDDLPTCAVPVAPWPNAARRGGPDGHRVGAAALVGTAVAVTVGWITVANGMGPADALSQTYDAVFHYSAVAHIVGTGDGSSLTLSTLTNPASATAFYPGAWHDLVALVVLSTGAGVLAATNATALAVAALAWPLGCLALARQVFGRSVGVALATPVLAVGFTAFPWALMSFGVLWPNQLGVALLPGALAALTGLTGFAREPALRPTAAGGLLLVALPTLVLAHPNALFGLVVLALFPALCGLAGLIRHRLLSRQWYLPVLGVAAVAGSVWLVVWAMVASPLLAGVRSYDWPAFQSTGQALWAVLTSSTNNRPEAWTISVLVLVGVGAALRRARTSWLVPAHLACGFLYLQAASQRGGTRDALTGAWYHDSYRLAALLPVTGTLLAVAGLAGLAGLLRRAVPVRTRVRRMRRELLSPAALVAGGTALTLAISGGMDLATHETVLAEPYRTTREVLLAPGQREFLQRSAALIPPGTVVATNPFTGNALLYPLTGQQVLFAHLAGSWTPDQRTIAARLREAAADPAVCAALTATRTSYVITGPVTFWSSSGAAHSYPGLDDLAGLPGFELLADDGRNQLYRITICDTTQRSNSAAGTSQ